MPQIVFFLMKVCGALGFWLALAAQHVTRGLVIALDCVTAQRQCQKVRIVCIPMEQED